MIKLALTVEEESQKWAMLTNELALYHGNLMNIPREEGTDYPLKFKAGESSPTRQDGGAEVFNSEDPKSMGELEN